MYFALIKELKGMEFYGDVPEIFGEAADKYEKYVLSEEERSFLMNDFVDPINELCGTLLDFGDVDYFNSNQCGQLLEWLNKRLNSNIEKQFEELYRKLSHYCNEAISRGTGIVIEL